MSWELAEALYRAAPGRAVFGIGVEYGYLYDEETTLLLPGCFENLKAGREVPMCWRHNNAEAREIGRARVFEFEHGVVAVGVLNHDYDGRLAWGYLFQSVNAGRQMGLSLGLQYRLSEVLYGIPGVETLARGVAIREVSLTQDPGCAAARVLNWKDGNADVQANFSWAPALATVEPEERRIDESDNEFRARAHRHVETRIASLLARPMPKALPSPMMYDADLIQTYFSGGARVLA